MAADPEKCPVIPPADEATKEGTDLPETPLGKELKRILAPLESKDAWPKTVAVPEVDWADLISWHPAFRDILPWG